MALTTHELLKYLDGIDPERNATFVVANGTSNETVATTDFSETYMYLIDDGGARDGQWSATLEEGETGIQYPVLLLTPPNLPA
jgi:hypothetical protein